MMRKDRREEPNGAGLSWEAEFGGDEEPEIALLKRKMILGTDSSPPSSKYLWGLRSCSSRDVFGVPLGTQIQLDFFFTPKSSQMSFSRLSLGLLPPHQRLGSGVSKSNH